MLPSALTQSYRFWRTAPHTLRGYPISPDNDRELLVQLYYGRTGVWQAIVRRLPPILTPESDDNKASAGLEAAGDREDASAPGFPQGTETLLNLTDTSREGGALRRMAAVLSKVLDQPNTLLFRHLPPQ